MRRISMFWLIVAVPPCLVLAFLAGNEGLQRSISKGALTLITERPQAGLAVIGATLALSALAAPLLRGRNPLHAPLALLGWNLVAGLVLAPLAIGELEPVHAPLVIAATTVCGLTFLAAYLGAWARLRSGDATEPLDADDDPQEADA